MSSFTIKISWLNSVETLTLNIDALPEPGTVIATTESWKGQPDPVNYRVDVVDVARDGSRYTFTLGYDERRNSDLAGINTAWGKSTIRIDLGGEKPKATATWKNNPPDPEFDGTTSRVKVALVPPDSLLGDLLKLDGRANLTERETLIAARIGQGRFRSDVIKAWKLGETCALTKIAIPEMLVASHIKPWRDCENEERLDPANGLLLATHVDKLFDRFLLSFRHESDSTCVVQLHPRVRAVATSLGLEDGKQLDLAQLGDLAPRFRKFMQGHYERFLVGCSSDEVAP